MNRFDKLRLACFLVMGLATLFGVGSALYHWGWTDGFHRAVEITDEARAKR